MAQNVKWRRDRVVITSSLYFKEARFSACPQVGMSVIHAVCEGRPLMFAAPGKATIPQFESRNQFKFYCLRT